MNKIIKKQLEKVRFAGLPPYDDTTTTIIITKRGMQQEDVVEIGKYFQISIENYIINEPPNFTLSSNWNGGTKPTDVSMNVEITNVLGKMVKVKGVGVNDGKNWEGWLPRKSFKVEKEYNYESVSC